MMDIVFRGWDAVGGKGWVYGDLVHNQKVTVTGLCQRTMVGGYEVEPESVGQYTGMDDTDGTRVFHGDILKWMKDGLTYEVTFRSGMFYASVWRKNGALHGGFPLWILLLGDFECRVVGDAYGGWS